MSFCNVCGADVSADVCPLCGAPTAGSQRASGQSAVPRVGATHPTTPAMPPPVPTPTTTPSLPRQDGVDPLRRTSV